MTLRVPVTASSAPGWIRVAAGAINALIRRADGAGADVVALQAADTALDGRVTALETAPQVTTFASITLTPGALPGSPVTGQTVYDSADGIVKTWNGSAWNSHY